MRFLPGALRPSVRIGTVLHEPLLAELARLSPLAFRAKTASLYFPAIFDLAAAAAAAARRRSALVGMEALAGRVLAAAAAVPERALAVLAVAAAMAGF